jgi:thioredoxin-related protein
MKLNQNLILFPIIFFLLLFGSETFASSDTIAWNSYEKGMALGKKENKKIFINFYAQWCTYCTKMEKETFKDKNIIDYLNKHFISIKVDTDKNKDIADKYFVRGLPTLWFVSSNGNKISGLPGFINSATFINILKFVHTESYKNMTFAEYLKTL